MDFCFDHALGRAAEKIADSAANIGIMLLRVAESDSTLRTRTTLADILAAANTEANFTNYARKTGLTGTVSVDTGTHIVTIDVPDQTWTSAGGATNNTLVKAIIFYQDAAADATRIPLTAHDLNTTTDGTNYVLSTPSTGFLQEIDNTA